MTITLPTGETGTYHPAIPRTRTDPEWPAWIETSETGAAVLDLWNEVRKQLADTDHDTRPLRPEEN